MRNATRLLIATKTKGRCFYCNRSGRMEIDHFISRFRWKEWGLDNVVGSKDSIENLFLACRSCNARKNAKDPEDFVGPNCWSRYFRTNLRIGIEYRCAGCVACKITPHSYFWP